MEQDRRDSPPLWLQPPVTTLLRQQRRPSSSLIYNPVLLIPLLALILLFCLLSPFVSHTSQIIQITSVKNKWDSLNIVLVLFAILCGIAGKMCDRESSDVAVHKSNVSNIVINNNLLLGTPETGSFRFFEDFDSTNNYPRVPGLMQRRERRREVEIDDPAIKVIPVDTCVVRQPPQYDEPVKPAAPQPPSQKLSRRQLPKSVIHNEKQLRESEIYKNRSPPPPPPPPPLPVTTTHQQQKRNDRIERKKTGTTKEIVTVLASLYHQTKKKPSSMKTNIYNNHTVSPPAHLIPPRTPPPPPPPLTPPPASIFHNMFKKQTKSKRIYKEASPLPSIPPPPPLPRKVARQSLPSSIFNNIFKSGANSKRFNSSNTHPPPRPPPPPSSIFNTESRSKRYYTSLACQSPPSQPPPPPSKPEAILQRTSKPPLPAKFHKDYLYHTEENMNIFSIQSPRSQFEYAVQPELPRIDDWPTKASESVKEEIHSGGSILCPSPDVNTKAEKFIARLRDEWRLDKMNSYREKL